MTDLNFISALLIGLAGSVHCVGMCGGIVGALTFAIPKDRSVLPYILAYNGGRIFSYSLAGGVAGAIGQLLTHNSVAGITLLKLISGIFLLLLACYIGGWWRGLIRIEKFGSHLWKYISPMTRRFVPFKTPLSALPYGMLWGWLPCGLVYSSLTWALASGSAISGAKIMFAFGLGTLPAMLLLAMGFKRIGPIINHPVTKQFIALGLLVYGLFTIFMALKLDV